MMKKLALPAALIMAALASAPALADPGPAQAHNRAMSREHGRMQGAQGAAEAMDRLFDQLGLTADQRTKLKALRDQNKTANAEARKTLMDKHQALFKLIRQKSATESQALALQHEIAGLQSQLAESRIKAWFAARALLTADQLAKLETLQPPARGRGTKR